MNKGAKICKIKLKASSHIRYFISLTPGNFYICIWLIWYGIEIVLGSIFGGKIMIEFNISQGMDNFTCSTGFDI